jgi:hypothetical protein
MKAKPRPRRERLVKGPRVNHVVLSGRVEVPWSRAKDGWQDLAVVVDQGYMGDEGLRVVRRGQMVVVGQSTHADVDSTLAPGTRVLVIGRLVARRRHLVLLLHSLQSMDA